MVSYEAWRIEQSAEHRQSFVTVNLYMWFYFVLYVTVTQWRSDPAALYTKLTSPPALFSVMEFRWMLQSRMITVICSGCRSLSWVCFDLFLILSSAAVTYQTDPASDNSTSSDRRSLLLQNKLIWDGFSMTFMFFLTVKCSAAHFIAGVNGQVVLPVKQMLSFSLSLQDT